MHSTLESTSLLGLIVLGVIVGAPIYVLLLASAFGGPKVGRVRAVFFGTVVTMLVTFVVITFIMGGILSLIFPS